MLIGEVILTSAGRCRHHALLLTLMTEPVVHDVARVRGEMRIGPYSEPHAWNEPFLPGDQPSLVYVMNPASDSSITDATRSAAAYTSPATDDGFVEARWMSTPPKRRT